MKINEASAKIQVSYQGASPNMYIGNEAITFHLTRGYIIEGNTATFNDAVNFIGTVQAVTKPKEFTAWKFGFLQFQKVESLKIFYAGPKRKAGQLYLLIDRAPALSSPIQLDSEKEFDPWTHSFDATLSGTKITAISGDHPASRAPKKMTNSKTNAYNYLFHLIDDRMFWTVFTAQNPAGEFHHLAHVSWKVRYDFKFVWRNGAPVVHHNASRFWCNKSKLGAPSAQGLTSLMRNPVPPYANSEVRNAIKKTVLGGPPNRFDCEERAYVKPPIVFYK